MKAILYLLPAALLTIAACKKDKEIPSEGKDNTRQPLTQASIEGSWSLVKYYLSDGTSAINWQTPEDPVYLTFTQDGTVKENGKKYAFVPNWRSPSDTFLLVYRQNDTTQMRVTQLTKDKLVISYQCYEGCSYNYVRIGK
ncbi:hypothetical protein [Chitinophaga tropicalis]|uniref:Lipocalin-like domain-containing protein n=1 Tax=Chitinophaga tropicalis TaxID=2683588 RepID=A0A7K1UB64_9BACT|nr:hypothetical protein [Chitinophaga tropicalis]MVT11629.1 hypothetical protein [Chitinophaga tropicalis]